MKDKYNISILVPGMKFNGSTLDTASLGGTETAGLCLSREFARLGHNVRMFANCGAPGIFDGVVYRGIEAFQQNMQTAPGDILIVQRTPEPFILRSVHKLHLLWCHDLALGRQAHSYKSVIWNVDKFITVSDWMKKQYVETYGLPEEFIYASRNGLDLFRFPEVDLGQKLRKRLVYSARPERGLDLLLDRIFPALLEKDPEFELALFGYDNPVDHMKEFYGNLAIKAKQFGDKVRFMGNLAKPDQYRAYTKFGIYTYPTPSPKFKEFREVSCISAMEAMAAGMPIVTSRLGALSETIPETAGTLIDGDVASDEYRDAFVSAILEYTKDPVKYEATAKAGMEHAQNLSWAGIAKEWTEQFDRWIAERNDDRVRLAHHFYRRSDVFAARAALEGQTSESAIRLATKIEKEYAFTKSPEAFRKHYIRGGRETDKRLATAPLDAYNFMETNESRFHVIRDFLARHEECKRILDYGCGHGWSTIYLANQLGREWTGVDIDPGAVKWARLFAEKHGSKNAAISFAIGDHTKLTSFVPYDAAIISEVLEHCVDPYEVFEAVEKSVKIDGAIVITVPYGPSEYETDNWIRFRNHLWEFDIHDINDMFGKKPDYAVSSAAIYPNKVTDEMVGYHFITFRADHKPVGRIDMERKLRLQRPRETLSASIIAGRKAELTLAWCLESLRQFMDEIVIVDTGLDKLGLKIAKRYGARVIKGSDPLKHGFETPRNEGLKECSKDWVLWIDTDEKLINGSALLKYTRRSLWHGLSITQHHFSVDAGFQPDTPVRCFRRGPYLRQGEHKGKTMKFIGHIHEHPELDLNNGPGDVLILPDVHIAHVGYLDEGTRRLRFIRNTPLLQRDREMYPTRILQKHFVMRDNMLLCGFEAARNGNKVSEEMRRLSEETIALYREHFLGKRVYANIDSLQYYTQALQVLGRGVDVSFQIATNRDGVGDNLNNGTRVLARFETRDEAMIEIDSIVRQKFDPLQTVSW